MEVKKIVGSKESISIIDLELYDLDAKVDTGADSNALHCDDIVVDEQGIVHFTLLDEVHPAYHGKRMSMPVITSYSIHYTKLYDHCNVKFLISEIGQQPS